MRKLMLLLFLSVTCTMFAVYVQNSPTVLTQPDASTYTALLTGDEYYHRVHDENGFTVIKNPRTGYYVYAQSYGDKLSATDYIIGRINPSSLGIKPNLMAHDPQSQARFDEIQRSRIENRSFPIGTINSVVLFIRFNDQDEYPLERNYQHYDYVFNGENMRSMKDYYLEVSSGQLTINSFMYPAADAGGYVVSLVFDQPRGYLQPADSINTVGYEPGNDVQVGNRLRELFNWAVNQLDILVPESINIDMDNNGACDGITLVIRGQMEHALWATSFTNSNHFGYINGKSVPRVIMDIESHTSWNVAAHEMGHQIGSPDFYRYGSSPMGHYPWNQTEPVAAWDMMSGNVGHWTTLNKFKYGTWFSELPVIYPTPTPTTYTLTAVDTSPYSCYKIPSNQPGQYYMVEYRRQAGRYETQIPGSGLIVYRVLENHWGNAAGPPDEVYIYRPGGTLTLNGSPTLANFNAESGRTLLAPEGNADPWLWADTLSVMPGSIRIQNVGASGGETISFQLSMANTPAGTVWTGAESTDWHNPANWSGNVVPGSGDDVLIVPSFYGPSISGTDAHCKNLVIGVGAKLGIGYANLLVYEDLTIYGEMILATQTSNLYAARDVVWKASSELTVPNAGAKIFCKRGMTFEEGSNVQAALLTITFFSGAHNPTVDYDAYIVNKSANTLLGNVISDKAGLYSLQFSALSTQPFTIDGDLKCYQNRRIRSFFNGIVSLKGNLISENTNGPGIYWQSGTLELAGTNQIITIPHGAGYLNNLVANNTGTVTFPYALNLNGNLQVGTNAQIVINENDLTVQGAANFAGSLAMNSAEGSFSVYGSMVWAEGSNLDMNNDGAEIYCKGSLTLEDGSHFNMGRGLVEFFGDNDRILVNHSYDTKFHHLRINKSGGAALAVSASSSQYFYINGDFTNNQNSIFRSYFTGNIYLKGNFTSLNTNSAGINLEAGTLVLNGASPHLALAHPDDYLYSLLSQPTANGNSYITTNVTIKGNCIIDRGPFFVGANTISVGGNWSLSSSATFQKGTSTVIFNGTGTQMVSSSVFNNLRLNKVGGGSDNKLLIQTSALVSASSFKYDAGIIEVNGGYFRITDLADATVKGNYIISSGTIFLTQDSQNSVDLDANLSISGGRISISGGNNNPVRWAYSNPVTLIMSGGELDFNMKNIELSSTSHSLNLQLSGGKIRTQGSFIISRNATNLGGGLVELYGDNNVNLSSSAGSSFNDVKINKFGTPLGKVTLAQNATIAGDLTVQKGILKLNAVTANVSRDLIVNGDLQMFIVGAVLNVGRDLTLGASSNADISQGTLNITRNLSQAANTPLTSSLQSTLNFVGSGDSNLTIMNPTSSLGNLGINKSSGTVGISTTAAALNILGNMNVSNGNQFMFRTTPTVIGGALNVNGAILLQAGGSVTCYDLNMYGNISVAGALTVQHDYYQAPATQLIVVSSGNFIIDKAYTGNFMSFAGTTILNGGAITITNEGIQFGASSNLTINSGTLKIGSGLRAMVADSFHMSTGSIEFIGNRSADIQLAEGNYLNNLVISKTGTGTVMLGSNLLINDLTINSGTFQLLHRTLNIAGNLNIISGTLDGAFADDLINLNGWWNNNRSPNGFIQGLGTVALVGSQRSVIYQSEQFNNLIVNKTELHPNGVEVETGATVGANNINFMDGTIYLKGGSTFNTPVSGFTLPPGCAVYCDPSTPSTLNLNGDWFDSNIFSDANQGFSSGASVMNVLGAGPRSIISSVLKLNSLNVNLSSGECYISDYEPEFTGNVHLQSGTLSANYGSSFTFHKDLSTNAGTTLALSGCALAFIGDENAQLSIIGASDYWSITFNKALGSSVSLGNNLNMPAFSLLNVQQGILQLASQVLSAGGDVNIGSGGEILVNANAQFLMQGSNLLNVNSGGKLSALGTIIQPALISRSGAFYYSLNVNSGGTIAAEHAIFEYMDYSGVNVNMGASVSPEYSFNNCTFRNGTYGGTLLNFSNAQALTITGAVFPDNSWFGMSNVAKSVDTGSVRFLGESGAFAGAGFESDPFMRINWNNDVPSIAADQSSLSFGDVFIPMSEYRSFNITNSGSGSLAGVLNLPDDFTANIYRAESREGNRKIDEPQRTGIMEFVVLPGSSIQVQVVFMPTQPISYNSTLVITHNAGGAPINISLTGYGMGAQITVNPNQIIKGILPGGSHAETLSITDSGNTALSYYATIEYPTRSRDVIMSESFETGFPPSGWSTAVVQQVGTAGVWSRATSTVHPGGNNAQDGQYLAIFNSWTCSSGNQTRLQTGYLNFSGYSNVSLSFWMFHDNQYPSSNDRIQVQINQIQDDWVNVGDPIVRTQSPYGWQQHTISLSAYGNQNYLRLGLLGISQYGNDLNLDNIVITGSNPPTSWVFFNGQATSVSNIIAPNATDQHQVNIYTSGMDPGTYQAEIHIATNDPITSVKIMPITVSIGSPGLSVSPVAIDFGVRQTGTSATRDINIEATGSLHLSGTITAPAGYNIQASTRAETETGFRESAPNRWSSSVDYILAPGELKTYQVKFSPTAIQAYNGSISITSDHLATQTIQLCGTGANIPTIQTLSATDITSSTATLNATISSTGGLEIWGRGFKYGTDPDPINNGNDYFVASSNNTYSAFPTGFEAGQQIYFCAFAYNELGWSYGDTLTFVTLNPQLIVTPTSAVDFGSVSINTTSDAHSFTVSGSDLSGAVGINASEGFRIYQNRNNVRATSDQISLSPLNGILVETTIFVVFEPTLAQPYEGSIDVISPGLLGVFITLSGTGITVPTLTTIEATEITQISATSGGEISDEGGSAIITRGVCWSDQPDPSLADSFTTDDTGSGLFSSYLSNLLPGTQYFVSAYATNLAGTAYGASVSFVTQTRPVIAASPTALDSFGGVVIGTLSASKALIVAGEGLSANLIITAPSGFQIAQEGRGRQRDYGSEISIVPSSGSVFETILVRFAPISGGGYSDLIVLSSTGAENKTAEVTGIGITQPVLSTKPIIDISSDSASSGGLISSDGWSGISVCGICWSLSPVPTTADFITSNMPVDWDYTLVMNSLMPNTTYFVRAFAINAAGTAYGNELSFRTSQFALGSPANFSIVAQSESAILNWDTVPGAVSYKVYRSLNPYATDWGAPVVTTSNRTWTDTSVSQRYFYKVTASSEIARD